MNDKENIRNLQNFAEVEFMIDQYFDRNLQKLVDKGYQELRDNQSTELAQAYEKKSSPFMADPRIAMQQAMYEVKASGKWNTKHTEDLVLDVNKKFYGDKNTAEDLVLLKENWKYCAISRLGQARYDELSKKCSTGDLASEYFASRLNDKIIKRLARLGAPKSTLEYVFTTGIKETFIGFISQSGVPKGTQSGTDILLEQEKEALFSDKARWAARGVGFIGDMATPGLGFSGKAIKAVATGSAKRLVQIEATKGVMSGVRAGVGVAVSAGTPAADLALRGYIYNKIDKTWTANPNYTKDFSKEIFGDERALGELRSTETSGVNKRSQGVNILNSALNKKVLAKTTDSAIVESEKNALVKAFGGDSENAMSILRGTFKNAGIKTSDSKPAPGWMAQKSEAYLMTNAAYYAALAMEMKRKGIGSKMVGTQMMSLQEVAQKGFDLGRAYYDKQLAAVNKITEKAEQEQAALEAEQARQAEAYRQQQERSQQPHVAAAMQPAGAGQMQTVPTSQGGRTVQPTKENMGGWGNMMDQLGLKGLGDIGNNMGYIFSMLPDMLLGMFTGQTKSLHLKDNMFPIAAIVAGFFIKNPLLKMLLIGLGGANLLNKAGHEYMAKEGIPTSRTSRVSRTYDDELLDARVSGQPVMKGNTLIASIDGVPSVITIDDATAAAYEDGKIPLNTLCNAVLRKYDEQRAAVSNEYERTRAEQEEETVSRGIR